MRAEWVASNGLIVMPSDGDAYIRKELQSGDSSGAVGRWLGPSVDVH